MVASGYFSPLLQKFFNRVLHDLESGSQDVIEGLKYHNFSL